MLIRIDDIDPPADGVRRRAASIEDEAALQASIASLGVLQPILVSRSGNRYEVIAGERRLRAARAAGLDQIPAEVCGKDTTVAWASAAATAENMVRAPLEPIDQWLAITRLQSQGYSLVGAAEALGLTERRARQLDKLGRLHPDVLATIEETFLPEDFELSVIASAPPDVQQRAVQIKGVRFTNHHGQASIDWARVRQHCARDRIPRGRAVFEVDGSGVAFVEDPFAEPGADDEWTTTDVAGFLKAQAAQLQGVAQRRNDAGEKVEPTLCRWDGKKHKPKLTGGWAVESVSAVGANEGKTLPKHRRVFLGLRETGYTLGEAFEVVAKPSKKPKEAPEPKKKARAAEINAAVGAADAHAARIEADHGGGSSDAAADLPPDPPAPDITAAGMAIIAKAKTEALRETLGALAAEVWPHDLIGLLVLTLCSAQVRVSGNEGWGSVDFRDLAARLLTPAGTLISEPSAMYAIACDAIARIVRVVPIPPGHPRANDAEEWIGHIVDAQKALPRFDTEEFLAAVKGDVLRKLAAERGIKAKSVGEMRKRLSGHAEGWRPQATHFGAPAPVVKS